jgi:uncharacterized low-complexity protein
MTNNRIKPLAATLCMGFLAASIAPGVSATDNPFSAVELESGYQLAAAEKTDEGKCGEGKCGGAKSSEEGKCGEGKCGGDKDASAEGASDSDDKSAHEGKCGEGKCGGDKDAG